MRKYLSRITLALLAISFATVLVVMIGLPWFLDSYLHWTFDQYMDSKLYRIFLIFFLYFNALGGLVLLANLMMIMKSVDFDPFIPNNVKALRRLGFIAFLMAISFFVKCILYFTPFTFICGLILLLCSLFALVLAQVFAQAVIFKLENDLTI